MMRRSTYAVMIGTVVLAMTSGSVAEPPAPSLAKDRPGLLEYVDERGRERAVRTPEEWRERRAGIVAGMESAMGRLPERDDLPPLDVRVGETVEGEGYVRQTLSFVAEAGDRVSAYLYLPEPMDHGSRRPAMLALHPTHRIGKGVVDGQSERPNRAYAKELAQRGYVVIAPDYPSFGDSAGYDFDSDRYASGTMKGIFNHMRCVDLLRERAEVDPERIGVIGHSLGGHNAMFVGVFDERLKVIVSSCGWTPFHDYYGGDLAGWTSDRYMPRLRDVYDLDPDRVPFDFHEVVAALAPRPFFSNSPLHDDNFAVAGVRKAVPRARRVYELLGAADRLRVVYPDTDHDFPPGVRREAYRFIDEALGHEPDSTVDFKDSRTESLE